MSVLNIARKLAATRRKCVVNNVVGTGSSKRKAIVCDDDNDDRCAVQSVADVVDDSDERALPKRKCAGPGEDIACRGVQPSATPDVVPELLGVRADGEPVVFRVVSPVDSEEDAWYSVSSSASVGWVIEALNKRRRGWGVYALCSRGEKLNTALHIGAALSDAEHNVLTVQRPPAGNFRVVVATMTGNHISIETSAMETVIQLKRKIENKEGIPVDQQRFVFGGKQLDDGDALFTHGICEGAKIHMILRLRGGMMHPTSGRTDGVSPTALTVEIGVTKTVTVGVNLWKDTPLSLAQLVGDWLLADSAPHGYVWKLMVPRPGSTRRQWFSLTDDTTVLGEAMGATDRGAPVPHNVSEPQRRHGVVFGLVPRE